MADIDISVLAKWISISAISVLANIDIGHIGIGQISVKIHGYQQKYRHISAKIPVIGQISAKMIILVSVSVADMLVLIYQYRYRQKYRYRYQLDRYRFNPNLQSARNKTEGFKKCNKRSNCALCQHSEPGVISSYTCPVTNKTVNISTPLTCTDKGVYLAFCRKDNGQCYSIIFLILGIVKLLC
jgi:hypothetical protein